MCYDKENAGLGVRILAVLALLVHLAGVNAQTISEEDLWWLRIHQTSELADYVVIGKVIGKTGFEREDVGQFYTKYTLNVSEYLAGDVSPDSLIDFTAWGGTAGGRGQIISGSIRPTLGHEWLVFLRGCEEDSLRLFRETLMARIEGGIAIRPWLHDTITVQVLRDSLLSAVSVRKPEWQRDNSDLVLLGEISSLSLSPANERYASRNGVFSVSVTELFKVPQSMNLLAGDTILVNVPVSADLTAGTNRTLPKLDVADTAVFFLEVTPINEVRSGKSIWSKWRREGASGVVESWQERICPPDYYHRHHEVPWDSLLQIFHE